MRARTRSVEVRGHTRTVAEADRPPITKTPLKMYAPSAALYSMRVSRCSVLDTVDALITREAPHTKNARISPPTPSKVHPALSTPVVLKSAVRFATCFGFCSKTQRNQLLQRCATCQPL